MPHNDDNVFLHYFSTGRPQKTGTLLCMP